MISRGFCLLLTLVILLQLLLPVATVHASPESIPINGRYSTYTIGLRIPATPKWAHDIVVNASIAWNEAQLWYQQSVPSSGKVYALVESGDGLASISFTMPSAYSSIAVGWTDYSFAPSSKTTIVSTQTYLDPSVFNSQESNVTGRQYALRLALHELGRVLGLGSVLDDRDIMDPMSTPSRVNESPAISTLDLYALNVLASGNAPSFVTLPSNIPNQFFQAGTFLSAVNPPIPTPEFNGYSGVVAVVCALGASLILRRRK